MGLFDFDIPWPDIWQDLVDFWLWIPRRVFELVMAGLAEAINQIPVAEFLATPPDLGGIEGIGWAFWLFHLTDGFGLVVGAYILRFGIRRLPVVG